MYFQRGTEDCDYLQCNKLNYSLKNKTGREQLFFNILFILHFSWLKTCLLQSDSSIQVHQLLNVSLKEHYVGIFKAQTFQGCVKICV